MPKFEFTWAHAGTAFLFECETVYKVEAQEQWLQCYPDHAEAGAVPRVVLIVSCCNEDVRCHHFTATCEHCGADYNSAGQRLAPRSQWGKETGEHWSECY